MHATGRGTALDTLMGRSLHVGNLQNEVMRVAGTDYAVLILGETGTGKELVARAIQAGSRRSRMPFVAVDCGAIPETLMESELFGHERGAFTGADRREPGKIEAARGGTLFLDEISNLPISVQVKMLRLLQEKCFYRVGASSPSQADVRIVCATNADPTSSSTESGFRRDLYYRIAEYIIHVPPLRERKEDIAFLAERFVREACGELGKDPVSLTHGAISALAARDWPGNVRELRNVVRRAVLLADDEVTEREVACVCPDGWTETVQRRVAELLESTGELRDGVCAPLREIVERSIAAVENIILRQALEHCGGNKAEAARLLQVDYKTIHVKIKKYGISTKCIAQPGNGANAATC